MNYNGIFENVIKLHDINFNSNSGIIHHKYYKELKDNYFASNEEVYTFPKPDEKSGFFKNDTVCGCCCLCDDEDVNPDAEKLKEEKKETKYSKFKLHYVSHGSHSVDFLCASGKSIVDVMKKIEQEKWITTPILFLMENPSVDYDDIYKKDDESKKAPSKTWYWIHNKETAIDEMAEKCTDYYRQGKYGEMVYALICEHKLANAYLTNVVKCGMNGYIEDKKGNEKESYLGTWWYTNSSKQKCIENHLAREIKALVGTDNELIVFAFGNNAYNLANDFLANTEDSEIIKIANKRIVMLPHPSSRLNNTFRRVLLGMYFKQALTDQDIGKIESLPALDDMVDSLKKKLKDRLDNIEFNDSKVSKDKSVIRFSLDYSLFTKQKIVKYIWLNNYEGMEIGYSFEDRGFWQNDLTDEKIADAFTKSMEEILSVIGWS